jgi:RNA polymerase sigma factor (TIGR02999 family)
MDAENERALNDLFTSSYKELHRLAKSLKRADSGATISTSTLVHEVWIKLVRAGSLTPDSQLHLKRIVAQAMRRYVTEAARRRCAVKRGGGAASFITLDGPGDFPVTRDNDLLALGDALDELAQVSPRQSSLIELRFYGGYEVIEAASILGIAETTALRDWRAAKAWLASRISPHESPGPTADAG